ncbi:MAG: energy-coupling factor ABC transporter ATP-binding protein [Geobacteraceae bacterium]|nr:energy-coupling factor ABC transporter ATP-binding protein [Geobacteraceae bacterium]
MVVKPKITPISACCLPGEGSTINPNPAAATPQIALEAEKLSFHYGDETDAVDRVDFRIMEGEAVALCGHNGSGKTTLMKLLAGLLKPAQGLVRVSGVELNLRSSREVFRTVGLLFQDPQNQLFCNEVWEDIAYGPRNMGFSDAEVKERVRLALTITETEHLEHRPIHHLSGGEMKRVALAGLVSMRTPVLILDEPFNGLDPASSTRLVALIRHLTRDHGYTMLMTTHQMSLVPEVADRMLVMQGGRLIADGSVRELLTNIPLLEQARLEPPSITRYFYKKALMENRKPERLPLTLDEALKWYGGKGRLSCIF